jgi:hypothetical protein
MGSIDLDEVSEDQLATRHTAAIRSTFDQDWKILEPADNQNKAQRTGISVIFLVIIFMIISHLYRHPFEVISKSIALKIPLSRRN